MGYLLPRSGGIARKTVTFTGAAGLGATGTVALFTVTGRVIVQAIAVWCTTGFTTTTTGSISLGTTSQVTRFLALLAAAGGDHPIDTDEWWAGATPTAGSIDLTSASAGTNDSMGVVTAESILYNITVNAFTAGVSEVYCIWEPLSAGATLVAA